MKKSMNSKLPKLFFSNTRIDKDLKHLLGCDIGGDIAVIKIKNKLNALASALEINRLKNESNATDILPIEAIDPAMKLNSSGIIAAFLKHTTKEKTIIVHEKFPHKLALELSAMGFEIIPKNGPILPERSVKSKREIAAIKKSIAVVKACLENVREILRLSNIAKDGTLTFRDKKLTSEFLREEIENFCYLNGCLAEKTIVACGNQSADPHCQGHGPIYANQFIVIDLFPFDRESGYYADITRTFVRDRPTDAQVTMYETVKTSQEMVYKKLKNGVRCSVLMREILKYFESRGYKTSRNAKVPCGMFHSLGHGVGLEIHELPRISNNSNTLKTGNVITIEPGLYYPEIGGVRVEDDFLIASDKAIKLSSEIPCDWVIS
jgi:Xaa-Pro aminopeptidase